MLSTRTLSLVALLTVGGCAERMAFNESSSISLSAEALTCNPSNSDTCCEKTKEVCIDPKTNKEFVYGDVVASYFGYDAKSNGACTGSVSGEHQCAQFAKNFYIGVLNHASCVGEASTCSGFTQKWSPKVNGVYTNAALSVEESYPNDEDPLFIFRSSNKGWNSLSEPPRDTDILVFENGNAGHFVIASGATDTSDASLTEMEIPIIEENVAILSDKNNGPGGTCHHRILVGDKSGDTWNVKSGIGESYKYTGFIRHNLAGIFESIGWNKQDGISALFRAKYIKHETKLGWAFRDNKGSLFVHDVHGVKLQNFVNTNAENRFGTDGQTALALSSDRKNVHLLKEGFWGAYKCIPDSNQKAMGGAEYLGAPKTDELVGRIDGNCQVIADPNVPLVTYQQFEKGCLWWRDAVDGKVHIHLYSGSSINAEKATKCGIQVENNPPSANCVDDCSPGTQRCYDSNRLQICGHPGTDSCYHWLMLSCGGGTVCIQNECAIPSASTVSCDPMIAEPCTCSTGVTGKRWWRADCSGYNECICAASTAAVSSVTGTGGTSSVTSANPSMGGYVSSVSSVMTGGTSATVAPAGNTTSVLTVGISTDAKNLTNSTTAVVPASGGTTSTSASFVLKYESPIAGAISLSGWWQNPDGTTREWNPITECVDTNANDRMLECVLPVRSGSRTFEFQVNLSDGRFWGDQSCSPNGGCGKSIGILTLLKGNQSVGYEMKVNNTKGEPYYNGFVALVP